MKKLICIALALVMTLALSVTCFADTAGSGEVKASYVAGGDNEAPVYSVDVVFDDMDDFTYTDVAKKWNPESHAYDIVEGEGSWNKTTANITVKNHSNAAVDVEVTYAKGSYQGGVNGAISNGEFELASAVGKAVGSPDSKVATLTISGKPENTMTSATLVGTVTVSFS